MHTYKHALCPSVPPSIRVSVLDCAPQVLRGDTSFDEKGLKCRASLGASAIPGLRGSAGEMGIASRPPLSSCWPCWSATDSLETRLTRLGGVRADPVPRAPRSPLCRDGRRTEPLPTARSASPRLPPQQAHVLPVAPV